mmetsp:Transcript_13940/g.34438  ORF Transcript_13940/g.34438 Transcript_13940/m.34438 type:complete len:215 (-) Transcript_13940:465-1109(-)
MLAPPAPAPRGEHGRGAFCPRVRLTCPALRRYSALRCYSALRSDAPLQGGRRGGSTTCAHNELVVPAACPHAHGTTIYAREVKVRRHHRSTFNRVKLQLLLRVVVGLLMYYPGRREHVRGLLCYLGERTTIAGSSRGPTYYVGSYVISTVVRLRKPPRGRVSAQVLVSCRVSGQLVEAARGALAGFRLRRTRDVRYARTRRALRARRRSLVRVL